MSKKKDVEDPAQIGEVLSAAMLREMVNNLEDTKLKLLLTIKELKEKQNQQKDDQTDIYYYLNKKCDESFEVIASLEEQILNEQADREIAEKLYENKVEEMKAAALSNDAKYNTRIVELESRLEMLNAFSETKEETERNLESLMTKLEEERTQFSVNAESMENKFLLEREKLRKSYDVKYESIKRELEQSVDGKLAKKTKKTQIMNVVMKKELDSQSKHAEKLLEINQSLLEKDRELKLDLELSNSLQAEMTNKLAMYQRVVRQLNEKVASQDSALEALRVEHENQLRKKVETQVGLEARINQMNKRVSRENARLDEMWRFLAQTYQLIKRKGGGSRGSVSGDNSADEHNEHELLLVELIREVAAKHPKALAQLVAVYPSLSAETQQQQYDVGGASLASSSVQSSHVSSFATGIPSWDARSSSNSHDTHNRSQQPHNRLSKSVNGPLAHRSSSRSVAVQTEGRLAPYPQGSTWLDSKQQQMYVASGSAGLITGNILRPGGGGGLGGSVFGPGDDLSLDLQSMPSLWGDGAASVSLASVEHQSIKSASYALAPPTNATSKHKAMSKMRSNAHKHRAGQAPTQFRDIDQILSDVKARTHTIKHVVSKGSGDHAYGESDGSGGSVADGASLISGMTGGGGGGGADNHSLAPSVGGSASVSASLGDYSLRSGSQPRHDQRHRDGRAAGRALSGNTSSLMAIAGQGFVSPFTLPKLQHH